MGQAPELRALVGELRVLLESRRHLDRIGLEVWARHLPGEPVAPMEAISGDFEPFWVGMPWGGLWSTTWFHLRGRAPLAWAGGDVRLLVNLGGLPQVGFGVEAMVYGSDGRALGGLHHAQRYWPLDRSSQSRELVEIYVEAASNPSAAQHASAWPELLPDYGAGPLYRLEAAELVLVDTAAERLGRDLKALSGLVDLSRSGDLGRSWPEAALSRLAEVLASLRQKWTPADAEAASEVLMQLVAGSGQPGAAVHRVVATGHAHIDTAWLWPVREARRKVARTFASQLRLMERYPEHRFVASQAQHYQWVQQDHPELFAQLSSRVAEGRWEPVGGMWVEPDTNLPSGESLVRQVLWAKRYFLEHFGLEVSQLWLPDSFGFSAALPQIAVQGNMKALVTQKMSWNETNRMPHHSFWWQGHDGSRILVHFPPADTYNGDLSAAQVLAAEKRFSDANRSGQSLYLFGYGDGGGGPNADMLESARRLAGAEGLPELAVGSATEFLEALAATSGLATWCGEMYLETHRGTYTTHGDLKAANRRAEEALRQAEIWSVAAGLDPREELREAWRSLLVAQFHDILPGSSIRWVCEEALGSLGEARQTAEQVSARAQKALTQPGGPGELVVWNPSSYPRREVAELPGGELGWLEVPPLAWLPLTQALSAPPQPVRTGEDWMDNGLVRLTWDRQGRIRSVWDHRAQRELVPPGQVANALELHEDRPKSFDAWNVDRECLERFEELAHHDDLSVVETGPLRAGLRVRRSFGSSSLTQTVLLRAGSARVDFVTEVEWHEQHRLLKAAFPLQVHSGSVSYEIAHGHLERPCVENTSWDMARFEVPAHRWADLAEPGFGVALLNDSKYGYDARFGVLRLSLLRAPTWPDPLADKGFHRFVYSLFPHLGDLREKGAVIEEAEALNLPLRLSEGKGAGQVLEISERGVSVEAVKLAEDASGVVVRLCEVWGRRARIRLRPHFGFSAAFEVDLLERPRQELASEGEALVLELRPFGLLSLLLVP